MKNYALLNLNGHVCHVCFANIARSKEKVCQSESELLAIQKWVAEDLDPKYPKDFISFAVAGDVRKMNGSQELSKVLPLKVQMTDTKIIETCSLYSTRPKYQMLSETLLASNSYSLQKRFILNDVRLM